MWRGTVPKNAPEPLRGCPAWGVSRPVKLRVEWDHRTQEFVDRKLDDPPLQTPEGRIASTASRLPADLTVTCRNPPEKQPTPPDIDTLVLSLLRP